MCSGIRPLRMLSDATYTKLDFYFSVRPALELWELPPDRGRPLLWFPARPPVLSVSSRCPAASGASSLTAGPNAETCSDHLSGPRSPCHSRRDTCIVFLVLRGHPLHRGDSLMLADITNTNPVIYNVTVYGRL